VVTIITKKMYGWSKYGGAFHGLAKETLDEWHCQICGREHTREMPSYFISDNGGRDFFRICSSCKRQVIENEIREFEELLALKVANLITLPSRCEYV